MGSKKLVSHLIYYLFLLTLFPEAENPLKFAVFLLPLANYSSSPCTTFYFGRSKSILLSYFSWIPNYWWLYIRRMTDVLHKGPCVGEASRCAKQPIIFTIQWSAPGIFLKTFPRDKTLEPPFLFYIDFWPNIGPVNPMCKYEAGWQDHFPKYLQL